MSSVKSNKNLVGIGSILLIFPIASIVGTVLVLIGMKGLSDDCKVQGIYQNALRGLIFGIIALVALAASIPLLTIGGVFSVFTSGLAGVGFGLFAMFAAIAIVFVFYVLAAMYFKRAFSLLAKNR